MQKGGIQALELTGTATLPHLGPKRPYGQRVPQCSHDLDICRSQGVHWKDKPTHLGQGEGTCSQGLVLPTWKEDQRHNLCVGGGHRGRGYMMGFPIEDPTNKSWACGERGAEGEDRKGIDGWTVGRAEGNLPRQPQWGVGGQL